MWYQETPADRPGLLQAARIPGNRTALSVFQQRPREPAWLEHQQPGGGQLSGQLELQ